MYFRNFYSNSASLPYACSIRNLDLSEDKAPIFFRWKQKRQQMINQADPAGRNECNLI